MASFKDEMSKLREYHSNTHASSEIFADSRLANAVYTEISVKLSQARLGGKHGWWNSEVCDIADLKKSRDKAISENDHVSSLIYTAMIAMRESERT
ncbi:hypothetical protein [Photobacterium leiognathi]|uniref:hypothetical protein n=1 Tax=Photobacterium leiognathi TaxID=553611 RepID=UPI00298169C4|nr:hypothetical protein [Photobacterium leiognathi]